jgi:hypothetical protein
MREEYNRFMVKETARLRLLFPQYSKATIRRMAGDEWRANKGCGSGIKNRYATLKYEVNKSLIERVPQHDMKQYPDIYTAITRKQCIYCDRSLRRVSRTKGDHVFAVQADSSKPILTNFSAFTMPCCADCNSSRGNTPLKEFLMSDPKYQTNADIFDKILDIVDKNVVHYKADQSKYDDLLEYIQRSLEHIRHLTQHIPIWKLD